MYVAFFVGVNAVNTFYCQQIVAREKRKRTILHWTYNDMPQMAKWEERGPIVNSEDTMQENNATYEKKRNPKTEGWTWQSEIIRYCYLFVTFFFPQISIRKINNSKNS